MNQEHPVPEISESTAKRIRSLTAGQKISGFLKAIDNPYFSQGDETFNPTKVIEIYNESNDRQKDDIVENIDNILSYLRADSSFVQTHIDEVLDFWKWFDELREVDLTPDLYQIFYLFKNPSDRHHARTLADFHIIPNSMELRPDYEHNWGKFLILQPYDVDDILGFLKLAQHGDNPTFFLLAFLCWYNDHIRFVYAEDEEDEMEDAFLDVIHQTSKALCRVAGLDETQDGFAFWKMPQTLEQMQKPANYTIREMQGGIAESCLLAVKINKAFHVQNPRCMELTITPNCPMIINQGRTNMEQLLIYFCLGLNCSLPILYTLRVNWWSRNLLDAWAAKH